MTLQKAERFLRKYDRALRLRLSAEGPALCIERKVRCGRIGSIGPNGIVWRPDAGRRYEEGHVLVCSLPRGFFSPALLLETLRETDTWKTPNWIRDIEYREERAKQHRKDSRSLDMRYRASQVWDRYAWKTKSRVGMRI